MDYIAHIKEAIANAKEADSDRNHFFPKEKETKVYQLVEAIIAKATIKEFDDFLQKLQ